MKKLLCLVLALLLLAFFTLPSAAQDETAAIEEEKPQWQVTLEEEIIPTAILVVSSILTVIMTLWPMISKAMEKVKGAADSFASATDGVLRVTADGKVTQDEIKSIVAEAQAARDAAQEATREIKQVAEMFALLICRDERLVQDGTARRIMEVLEHVKGE